MLTTPASFRFYFFSSIWHNINLRCTNSASIFVITVTLRSFSTIILDFRISICFISSALIGSSVWASARSSATLLTTILTYNASLSLVLVSLRLHGRSNRVTSMRRPPAFFLSRPSHIHFDIFNGCQLEQLGFQTLLLLANGQSTFLVAFSLQYLVLFHQTLVFLVHLEDFSKVSLSFLYFLLQFIMLLPECKFTPPQLRFFLLKLQASQLLSLHRALLYYTRLQLSLLVTLTRMQTRCLEKVFVMSMIIEQFFLVLNFSL